MSVVIVHSGHLHIIFFYQNKKSWFSCTSTYKYKTIHTRVGCLQKGKGGTVCPTVQFAPFAQMYVYVCMCLWVRGLYIPLSVMEMNMSWVELAQGKVRGKWRRSTSPLSRQRPWCSEWLIVPDWEVSLWGRSTGWALVHALRAGALVLLFRAGAGGDCGGRGGGGAGLLLKVCYDHCDIPHSDGQLLGCAPVNVLQLGPADVEREKYSGG